MLLKVLGRFDDVSVTTLLKMVKMVYGGTSEEDGHDIRVVLATYCASRMGKNYPKHASCSQGFPRSFSRIELAELALTDRISFLYDVFLLIPAGPPFQATDMQVALYPDM